MLTVRCAADFMVLEFFKDGLGLSRTSSIVIMLPPSDPEEAGPGARIRLADSIAMVTTNRRYVLENVKNVMLRLHVAVGVATLDWSLIFLVRQYQAPPPYPPPPL